MTGPVAASVIEMRASAVATPGREHPDSAPEATVKTSHRPGATQMPRDYKNTPNPKGGGEIRIHGEDGKIRQSDAIATPDPFPPRG